MNTRSRPAVLASSTTAESAGGDPIPSPDADAGAAGRAAAIVSGASRLAGM